VRVFQDEDRNFLLPPLKPDEHLSEADHLDLCHEALLRQWGRLRTWLEEEAESAQIYRRLAETADLHAAGRASLAWLAA
jgi:hypothetical protein